MKLLCSFSFAFSMACALVTSAPAANVTVSTTLDEANGNTTSIANLIATPGGAGISLREAIIAANNTAGADIITLPTGTYTLTLVGNDSTCQNGDLDINGSLTINGAGPATTIVQGATDANFTGSIGDKIFGINQDGTFTNLTVLLTGMTIRYGRNTVANSDPSFAYTGAGVDVFFTGTGNSTTISNCVLTGNENVNAYGGGINVDSGNSGLAGDPAINTANRGTVRIVNCAVVNNKSKNDGAGINLYSDIHNVVVTNCVVTNNVTTTSGNGAGIQVRHSYGGTVSILNCNVSSNSAAGVGGGIYLGGNQHVNLSGTVISNNVATVNPALGGGLGISALGFAGFTAIMGVTNCTIVNNHADNGTTAAGGGVYFNGAYSATLENCTIRANTADNGAGIANGGSGLGASLTVDNCVVTNNAASASGGGVASLGSASTTFITKSTILGNSATTSGGGIYGADGVVSAAFNRIVNNTAPTARGAARVAGTINVTNTWWGTNAPAALMSGTVGFTPWLLLTNTASPSAVVITNSATLTASFLVNSAGTSIPTANLGMLTGVPIVFGSPVKGTLSGAQTAIQSSGTATATFNAGFVPGAGSANATVDGATATASITIQCPTINGTVSGGGAICAGGSTNVTVTIPGGLPPYTVTLNNGGGTITNASPLIFTVNPGATTTYSVSSATDSNGCAVTMSGSATVTVNASPATPIIGLSPTNPCPNATGPQAYGPDGAVTYSWTITNGTITGATNLQTLNYTPGNSGNVGLTLRVGNASGCTSSSSTNVAILVDHVAPTITCSTNITITTTGNCPAIVNFIVSATDNCGLTNLVVTPGTGSSFGVGTNIVNALAQDTSGNSNMCSFTVTVLAGTPPQLTAQRSPDGTDVVLSWPAAFGCYVLQSTPALVSAQWSNYTGSLTTSGGNNFVTNSSTLGNRFFRLAF
jgi:predicted outer membrane repeat protein